MAQQDTHARLRADADARTLRNSQQREKIAGDPKIGEQIGDVAMSLNEGIVGEAKKYIAKTGPTGQRLIIGGADALSRLPGYVYDAAKIATAKDKAREALGVVGGRVGSAFSGARMGALAGAAAGRSIRSLNHSRRPEVAFWAASSAPWAAIRPSSMSMTRLWSVRAPSDNAWATA